MRTSFPGEDQLRRQSTEDFPKSVTQIGDNVYFFLGYSLSNCILVIGDTSCLLIDTLSSTLWAEEVLTEIEKITDKPIKNIIYTHAQHPDHTSGASVFIKNNPQIYAHSSMGGEYSYSNLLKDIYNQRKANQFGEALTPQESLGLGIGSYFDNTKPKGIVKCTNLITEDVVAMDFDGIEVTLISAPGESDDQVYVWLPQYDVLCSGDNYYASWPNLYALRGGRYRDIGSWINSLDKILEYDPMYLLPGHSKSLEGKEVIRETITNYRDAIAYVLKETLNGMNEGETIDELAENIVLPEHLKNLPYLQEFYGTVSWTVRAIFTGYMGWFDGNPTKLTQLPIKEKAHKTIEIMGGYEKILTAIRKSLDNNEEQWALELCDILLDGEVCINEAKILKSEGMNVLARLQTSANARHYYLMNAKNISLQKDIN